MKFPFFKSLLVAGALLLAWNCSDNTTMSPINGLPALSEEARVLSTPDGYLYITEDGRVLDGQGVEVAQVGEDGTFTYGDNEYQFNPDELEKVELVKTDDGQTVVVTEDNQVKDTEGNVIGQKNDDGTITNENGDVIADLNGGSNSGEGGEGGENGEGGNNGGSGNGEGHQTSHSSASNGNNNNPSGNSSASNGNNNQPGNSSTSNGNNNTTTSTASGNNCEGQCYDAPSGKCVDYRKEIVLSNGVKYAYDHSCVLDCYWDPNNNNCRDVANATPASSASQQQTPSSSSKQQQTQSSSSKANGTTPNFKFKNGGKSGQGWGSRYWDCCKPHCAWSGKGGPIARTCNAQGQQLTKGDDTNKSICDGGNAGVCTNQAPFVVNDNLAYAFAAGPGNEYAGKCGSCFLLTFNGNSQHTTDARTQALKGKQMVIMISNIGYDVNGNQFDIMIPGGGVGAFDGCNPLWGIDQEARDGGFLKSCGGDKMLETSAAVSQVQSCLEQKCNSKFASKPEAKAGCLFHAQWLMAANNPQFTFQELESCPSELEARY